jgi:hypothetical protein
MSRWITPAEAWRHVGQYERDQARRMIFAALIRGELTAHAEYFTLDGVEFRDSDVPPEFWNITWSRFDFPGAKATRIITDCFVSLDSEGHSTVKQRSNDVATGIHLDGDMLLLLWPPISGPSIFRPATQENDNGSQSRT